MGAQQNLYNEHIVICDWIIAHIPYLISKAWLDALDDYSDIIEWKQMI